MNASDPTPRQMKVYVSIVKFIAENARPPTVREIGDMNDIHSPNGVMCHLKALKKKGWIENTPHSSRSIRITGGLACPCCNGTGRVDDKSKERIAH